MNKMSEMVIVLSLLVLAGCHRTPTAVIKPSTNIHDVQVINSTGTTIGQTNIGQGATVIIEARKKPKVVKHKETTSTTVITSSTTTTTTVTKEDERPIKSNLPLLILLAGLILLFKYRRRLGL